jgi:hypothetical protein
VVFERNGKRAILCGAANSCDARDNRARTTGVYAGFIHCLPNQLGDDARGMIAAAGTHCGSRTRDVGERISIRVGEYHARLGAASVHTSHEISHRGAARDPRV